MVTTTKAQRQALKRLYDRQLASIAEAIKRSEQPKGPRTYRALRKSIRPGFGGDYVMVPLWGMWLGIEADGYTHS
jgi:hypothetical protein